MNPRILGVSDTTEDQIPNYGSLSPEEKYKSLLSHSIDDLLKFLGSDRENFFPYITDFVSIDAAALGREGYGQSILDANDLGLTGIQCHTVDLGGASVGGALGEAARIAETNPESIVLVAAADIPKSAFRQVSDLKRLTKTVAHSDWEIPYGATLIGMYGLLAQKLMLENKITQEDLNLITKKFRSYAFSNPRAFYYQKEISDKQLNKPLAYPYSTPMIAIVTDHGFATLVVGESAYQKLRNQKIISRDDAVYIVGSAHTVHAEYFSLKGNLASPSAQAAKLAFQQSGHNYPDLEYAWIYDCFTGMIITQASNYFGENPKHVAEALKDGKIPIGEKRIPINLGGGILNYQAAMSISAATGLVDLLSQYGLASTPIPNRLPDKPKLSLLSANGGIDSINSVVLFSLSPTSSSKIQAENIDSDRVPDDSKNSPPIRNSSRINSQLRLNRRTEFDSLSEGEILDGRLLVATEVFFNPGGEKKPPYILALVESISKNFIMCNLQNPDHSEFTDFNQLVPGKTKIRIKKKDGIFIGIVEGNS